VIGVVDVVSAHRHFARRLLVTATGVRVAFEVTTTDASAAQAVAVQVTALAAQPAAFTAALVAAGVPTTGVVVAPALVLQPRAEASKEEAHHRWDASSARLDASGAVEVPDSGSDSAALTLSLSGQASVINYGFALEGSPSTDETHINGLVITDLRAPLTGGISIEVRAQYTIHASSTPLVAGWSDNHYRHLFNFGGVVAVLHGDKLWVGNTNGDSVNCAEGWLLSGGNASEPVWPVDTTATIKVSVLTSGKIGALLINGKSPPIAPSTSTAVPVAPGCQPLSIAASTHLFVGASGNDKYNDNFAGRVFSFSFSQL
jgi:hypothetical protein